MDAVCKVRVNRSAGVDADEEAVKTMYMPTKPSEDRLGRGEAGGLGVALTTVHGGPASSSAVGAERCRTIVEEKLLEIHRLQT